MLVKSLVLIAVFGCAIPSAGQVATTVEGRPIHPRPLVLTQDSPPKLSLRKALAIAEKFVADEKIDVRNMYLVEVRLFMFGSTPQESERAWQVNWSSGRWFVTCAGISIVVIDRTATARQMPCL